MNIININILVKINVFNVLLLLKQLLFELKSIVYVSVKGNHGTLALKNY